MKSWKRSTWYDQTGLAWIPPSPNIPTLTAAIVYPGTCLIEGTNVSEGRGTTTPFGVIGRPGSTDTSWPTGCTCSQPAEGVLFRPRGVSPRRSRSTRAKSPGGAVARRRPRPVRTGPHGVASSESPEAALARTNFSGGVRWTGYPGPMMCCNGSRRHAGTVVESWSALQGTRRSAAGIFFTISNKPRHHLASPRRLGAWGRGKARRHGRAGQVFLATSRNTNTCLPLFRLRQWTAVARPPAQHVCSLGRCAGLLLARRRTFRVCVLLGSMATNAAGSVARPYPGFGTGATIPLGRKPRHAGQAQDFRGTVGIEAVPIEVEVDVSPAGLPKTLLVGLPEAAVRNTHRVDRAIVARATSCRRTGLSSTLPRQNLPKQASFDLPITLRILIGSGAVPSLIGCLIMQSWASAGARGAPGRPKGPSRWPWPRPRGAGAAAATCPQPERNRKRPSSRTSR